MSELRTYYGPTPSDPDPGKQWHYGCGGEVLVFKDGVPVCMKCDSNTYEVCDHMVLLTGECELCKEAQSSAQLGEEMRETVSDIADQLFTCAGDHASRVLKYVGTLELLICLDRQCAHITAKCTHQTGIPTEEDSTPRKFVTSACTWNKDGTVLTCTYCGKDCS